MPTYVRVGSVFYTFNTLDLAVFKMLVACNPNVSERSSGELGLFVHFSAALIA